jgi:hypothetical protein
MRPIRPCGVSRASRFADGESAHGLIADSASYFLVFTAIFSCLPARNAGAIDALI